MKNYPYLSADLPPPYPLELFPEEMPEEGSSSTFIFTLIPRLTTRPTKRRLFTFFLLHFALPLLEQDPPAYLLKVRRPRNLKSGSPLSSCPHDPFPTVAFPTQWYVPPPILIHISWFLIDLVTLVQL